MTIKSKKQEWKAHVVILPSYCPVAIFITRSAALAYAEKQYGEWRAKGIRVQVATEKDWECIK